MDVIKSDRITLLPILNKSKQLILDTYLKNLLIAKNKISSLSIIDSSFQDLLFSNDKKLLNYYVNFSNPIFTGWELQTNEFTKVLVYFSKFFNKQNCLLKQCG